MFRVPLDADPAPREWEWNVALELISYAESLVDEVEAERARGLALNVSLAQSAFAAHYTANLIYLHRLLLCPMRRCSHETIMMDCDVALYTAFGLVAGCEEEALRSARMLCAGAHPAQLFLQRRGTGRAVCVCTFLLQSQPTSTGTGGSQSITDSQRLA